PCDGCIPAQGRGGPCRAGAGPGTEMCAVSEHRVSLSVNDSAYDATVEARTSLADLLRDTLGLTGTHVACAHGVCGSCTVLLDGEPVRSCLLLAVQADGATVETIEGLATSAELHPLQAAFRDAHAFQCGF